MRLVLFSAAIALFALPFPAQARTEGVPRLAVERSCHAAETYGLTDPEQTYKSCMLDEDEAKGTLEKNWSSYKPATKRDCITAGAHPSPSYVELLTCIEMTEEILVPANGGVAAARAPMAAAAPGPWGLPRPGRSFLPARALCPAKDSRNRRVGPFQARAADSLGNLAFHRLCSKS